MGDREGRDSIVTCRETYAIERVMHECVQILLENVKVVSREGEYEFALKFWYYEPSAKNQCGGRQKV